MKSISSLLTFIALAASPVVQGESWFTELEDVAYSVVEYIPFVGTIYSMARTEIAIGERQWKAGVQSLANYAESSIRDIILVGELALPTTAVILHTMSESFTDRMISIYAEPKHQIKINQKLNTEEGQIVIAEGSNGKFAKQFFGGKAKGVHYFHDTNFKGTFKHSDFAPEGEDIRLHIPHGLYEGAPVTFSWKWTIDHKGIINRPEATFGYIHLEAGCPTRFGLAKRKGAGGWEGYDFWGEIISANHIKATIGISNRPSIDFRRV